MELSEREYMVRGLGYLKNVNDIENVVVGATKRGTPIRVAELGRVSVGPAIRRGIADLDGRGDAVGGIVVMRFGQNALATIDNVKAKLAEVQKGLPAGCRRAADVRPQRSHSSARSRRSRASCSRNRSSSRWSAWCSCFM